MKIIIAAAAVALAFASPQARAQERAGSAAIGAVSGAVVLGPVGAVAGAVIGYAAGPEIVVDGSSNNCGPFTCNGFTINSPDNTIRNLIINHFTAHGITMFGGGTGNVTAPISDFGNPKRVTPFAASSS